MVERVLVLPRHQVPGGTDFIGVKTADDRTMALFRAAIAKHGRFMDRPLAEEDPGYKQLIPYVILWQGPQIYLMERTAAGGDSRLHGKASIGVGGHVNPMDYGVDALRSSLPIGSRRFGWSGSSMTIQITSDRSTLASYSKSRPMADRSRSASATS